MQNLINKLFNKNSTDKSFQTNLPTDEKERFLLKFKNLLIGTLMYEGRKWIFKYSDEFNKHSDQYNLSTGFSNVDKKYENDDLCPFFEIRIPGLKQPSVQKVIEKDHIDHKNKATLLKRFGYQSISNLYKLEPV